MRKILLTIIGLWCYLLTYAQTPTQITTIPGTYYVYVGSLEQDAGSSANSQKIVVKILGGSWFSDSNGETTYYISNRSGLTIKQVSLSSYSANKFSIKAYQNGQKIDFYLVPNPDDYTSFAVTSFSFGHSLTPKFINVVTLSSAPQGVEIEAKITPMLTTNWEGNVGIGTVDPKAKLAVEGNILAKEIKVTNNIAVPDYVFEPNYQLNSLSEIEAYVKENKHLPEIPSAREIEKNGLDLGEMNLLLLKKVEELTLHLIEKDKRISELELLNKRFEKLEQRINAMEASKN